MTFTLKQFKTLFFKDLYYILAYALKVGHASL